MVYYTKLSSANRWCRLLVFAMALEMLLSTSAYVFAWGDGNRTVVPPVEAWYLHDYLYCDFSNKHTLQDTWPGDDPIKVLNDYVQMLDAQCAGSSGAFYFITHSVVPCIPNINVSSNGANPRAFAFAIGCSIRRHATPTPSCSGTCQPWTEDINAPATFKECVGPSGGYGNNSRFTLTAPPSYGECMCPEGTAYLFNSTTGTQECLETDYYISPDSTPDKECEGNPCHPATGNKSQLETDISELGIGGIAFTRFYNSLGDHNSSPALAPGWRHTYERRLNESTLGTPLLYLNKPDQSSLYDTPAEACINGWQDIEATAWNGALSGATATLVGGQDCRIVQSNKTVAYLSVRPNVNLYASLSPPNTANNLIILSRPNGQVYHFEKTNGVWSDTFSPEVSLVENNGEWVFTDTDTTQERYNSVGNLIAITDIQGRVQTLTYDAQDRLDRVTGDTGEFLQFGYDTEDRISTVTDQTNRTWTYRYSTNDNLEYVDNPDNTTRQYHFEDPNFPNHLTGITDERGIRYATYAYNADGKAILSEHASGTEHIDLTYNPDGTTTVTGSRGDSRTYNFAPQQGQLAVTQITGDLCTDCPNGDKKDRSYDTNGYLSSYTDWSNAITEMGNYDAIGQLGFKIEAKGTSDERRSDYSYDPRFNNKTTTITAPSVFSP